jgi:hypothetical protein
MMRTWDLVAAKLETLRGEPATPEDITLAETTSAYKGYKKAFWKAYRELERRDRDA